MIRQSKILPKNKIFDLVDDKSIAKVELKHQDNKRLNDPTVVKAYIFHRWPIGDLHTIAGNCKSIASSNSVPQPESGLVAAMADYKHRGYYQGTNLIKLMSISDKYGVNIGMSRRLKGFLQGLGYNQS